MSPKPGATPGAGAAPKAERAFAALRAWTEARLGRREAMPSREGAPPRPASAAAPPPADPAEALRAGERLAEIARTYDGCTRCPLSKARTNIVFGQGSPTGPVLIIGEAPGAEEDKQGLAFVGRSGQLLTKMLAAIDLDREKDCFISNTVKCRPPENRNPLPGEMDACDPILSAQIEAIRPRVILALGNFAAKRLLGRDEGITKLRGRVYRFRGVPILATFHPAYLLRAYTVENRKKVFEDMKRLRRILDGEEKLPAGEDAADSGTSPASASAVPATVQPPRTASLFE